MICRSCHHENRDRAAFCEACGAPLARHCTRCGNELRAEARFCDACGEPAAASPADPRARDPRDYTPRHLAERILTSKAAMEGERKHVTVLFADVAGYTALSEDVDPEEIHALMDRSFQRILEQVHRYEGTVNQFTGDGVMALFGAPVALEDAPRRAVLAALAIQRALAPLDEEVRAQRGRPFRWRIGIHTGPVVVATIGDDLRMDYTAVGDTTNLAARLQQQAEPGSVLVSETTAGLVSGYFDVRDLGRFAVKGKAKPVQAYEVLAERSARGRIDVAAGSGLTRLVGRESELDALMAAFEAADRGSGQVVFLVGEAGIGKSRLLYEFRRRLAERPHAWFEGRCASYGADSAFLPVVDGLRRAFSIEDRDDDAAAAAKVERGVAALGDDFEWTLPYLRGLLSLPVGNAEVEDLPAEVRRSESIRALHALVLRGAERAPVVAVVEDLHWIDAASEELLGFLAESIPATRALLVLTHRPGYRHPFGDRSYHVRMALRPLSLEQTGAMTQAVLETADLPDELGHLIAAKSDGNPLFIEEVTRSLLEEGVVRLERGRVELTGRIEDISVPDSIHGVLMARIDRLPEEPKRAIQVAAVIGREFALRLLERITEAGDRVQGVVGELRALELIYEKAAHPELAFMFKHALTHDVAYESVLIKRRRALHGIVGAAIEELYRDRLAEHYEALAHHFTQAEDWPRAAEYHEQAARKAAGANATQTAVEHCRRALEIGERAGAPVERLIALEQLQGGLLWDRSEFQLSGRAFARAAELDEPGPRRALNQALASTSLLWAHSYDEARDAVQRAHAEGRACGSDAALGVAHSSASLLACVHGEITPEVLEEGRKGAELAEASGNGQAIVAAVSNHALFCKHVGDFRESLEVSERALEAARQQRIMAAMPLWVRGLALGGLGRYGEALALFRDAIEVCERIGQRALQTRLLNSLGWLYAEFGCHEQAAGYNRRSTEMAAEIVKRELVPGAPELYANAKINLSGNHLMLGDVPAAAGELEPICDQLDQPGDPWMRWRYAIHLLDARARVAHAQGEVDAALALLDEEIRAARAHQMPKAEARGLELRGRVLAAEGQDVEAEEALRAALAIGQRIEYPPVVWRAHAVLAEIGRRVGERAVAERHAAEVHSLIGSLAASLEPTLRTEFTAMGRRLAENPLSAYR